MFFSFGSIANEIFVLKISFDAANRRQIILHACIKGFTISGKNIGAPNPKYYGMWIFSSSLVLSSN